MVEDVLCNIEHPNACSSDLVVRAVVQLLLEGCGEKSCVRWLTSQASAAGRVGRARVWSLNSRCEGPEPLGTLLPAQRCWPGRAEPGGAGV